MVSGHTGNVVPGNRLRVRVPCPPLSAKNDTLGSCVVASFAVSRPGRLLK